jgi:hypothetical protein
MVFPTKHLKISESLFGLGSCIISIIKNSPKNLDKIWEEYKKINNTNYFPANHSFDHIILAVDYLYLVGLVDLNEQGEICLCN